MPLAKHEAEAALEGADVVPLIQAGVAEAKDLHQALLDADVPVVLGRDSHCTKGCAPKLYLLVREADIPTVAQMMRNRQMAMLERAGVDPSQIRLGIEAGDDENPPCPACGSVGDLVEGACPECGLQLG